MNKRRLHTPVILMLLAIMAVLGFQIYWLNKNYREEKQLLHIRTNVLFRDAVNECQVEKLKLDSNIVKVRVSTSKDAVGMMNVLRKKVNIDSLGLAKKTNSTMIITVNDEKMGSAHFDQTLPPPDSLRQNVRFY